MAISARLTLTPHTGGNALLMDGKLTAALPPHNWNVIRLKER